MGGGFRIGDKNEENIFLTFNPKLILNSPLTPTLIPDSLLILTPNPHPTLILDSPLILIPDPPLILTLTRCL